MHCARRRDLPRRCGSRGSHSVLPQDDTQQSKYDITIRNDASSALSDFSTRVYFDIAELISAGLDAVQVRCDKRYDSTGAATCSIAQFNGSTYYAELRFGTFSLAAGASAGYKLTLRLADYSRRWSSANDYSRVGLSSAPTVTSRLPVYQGTTRISGTDPGAGTPGPTPTPTIDTVAPSVPSAVQAQAVSSSRIDLSWNASTDNVAVSGYRVYRDSALVASPASTSFSDTNRAAATVYTYVVRAIDAASNLSAASAQVSVQTQPGSGSGDCS
ncbi:MAG: fibronectin type III domain-containing protein, partial [Gammaproteobacteria bacterium]|nr:fibronectin type III domain-containing protein [Gammaproteobacteria bacterium]